MILREPLPSIRHPQLLPEEIILPNTSTMYSCQLRSGSKIPLRIFLTIVVIFQKLEFRILT